MKIIIEADPKEIAALVLETQERQSKEFASTADFNSCEASLSPMTYSQLEKSKKQQATVPNSISLVKPDNKKDLLKGLRAKLKADEYLHFTVIDILAQLGLID